MAMSRALSRATKTPAKKSLTAILFALAMAPLVTPSLPVAAQQAVSKPAAQRASDPDTVFQTLLDDHWAAHLERNPVFATSLGNRAYDDRLGSYALATYDAMVAQTKGYLTRLDAIDRSALSARHKVNYDLFRLELEQTITDDKFGNKYLITTNREGPHTQAAGLPDSLPFFTRADYQSYIARLRDLPRYLGEAEDVLAAGAQEGWTQPCEPMKGLSAAIRYHVVEKPQDSVFMRPFETRPEAISTKDWKALTTAGRDAISSAAIPAFAAYADFYDNEYAAKCRKTIGATTYPDGKAFYASKIKAFTTTDKTADEIHAIGLNEVKRIRGEMDKIIRTVNFQGSFKDFQVFLRNDPQFYAKTPEELVQITSAISKRIDGELPKLFRRMPRMPYTVKPVPADIAEGTTTAYYERPAGDGSRAGVYRINTSLLDQRPVFELEALTLHEAVPGHHFQIALSQELDLPGFRAYAYQTAFVEGWGLYAESLGLDVGFYADPYQNFGRLSYEMWRACRLVVDTGMHAKGWTRQEAIDFMLANTALSEHNVVAEIDRYITWPGQALAYKMGELKIQALRRKTRKALGDHFDLRRFHDAVLENGAVPLSVLDQYIDAFLTTEKARTKDAE
ncbi:MAG: DUF885 domain-containing protein [Pseudomonadota bacterium]